VSASHEKSILETTLPGVWDREVIDGPERELQLLYFTADGNWKQQKQVSGAAGNFFGQLFGTERTGKWVLRGIDSDPVLHMRLHDWDLGVAGQVFLPLKKAWEALERVDPIPFHRYELVEITDDNHLVMKGINSILDGVERWIRRVN
jgi:hypothetical protein